jgi:glycerophosphoryl diester phosphodiesterase
MKLNKKPIIIAHRGGAGIAPENTLAAFKQAKKLGVDGIEIDVQLSADGKIVVIHDESINRTARKMNGDKTNDIKNVSDLTLDQLREYDFGIWFSKRFAGEQIPTLEEAMDVIGSDIIALIEIKAGVGQPYKPLATALAKFLKGKNNIIVSSFNPFALNVFRKKSGGAISTALLYGNLSEVPFVLRWGHGRLIHRPDILMPYYKNLLKKKDLTGMIAWAVDDPKIAKEFQHKNICGIITGYPKKMIRKDYE